jgi:hypothetical protein
MTDGDGAGCGAGVTMVVLSRGAAFVLFGFHHRK